ncbi:MarR family transcriptional regulator [Plantactinospora sp. S1510]|uniref:MarR family transcriptional regulator n=1 Tax=Plantactinospora alkalitolerans TaxID=2789879 RepID=A0ABS0H1T7_9ACTN|nr:MarR family transcriptional regulator [Plantactinospora alkalitolerans]MBF9132423.1 MarR family transcriptional regulator [Plantactinospora alkalitolerans]
MSSSGKPLFDGGADSADLEPPVRAFRLVLLLGQRMRYLMDERLRPDGLTTQQAALLTAVLALGRPTLTEAAAALGSTHQNVAQLVAALTRKGLLRVESDPADRRRRRLVGTEANAEYWRNRDDDDHSAVADWFAALRPAEIVLLCELAERVLADLADRRPASPSTVPGYPGASRVDGDG